MRYEKMLDPELCRTATERLLALLFTYDEGARVISAFSDAYVKKYPTITLSFDKKYVNRYTGIEISNAEIVKTLTGLGFKVDNVGDDFTVVVPSWRATKDVTIKADIIEEITRIYGYDNFDVFTSVSALAPVRKEIISSAEDRMKDILVKSYRMHEVHSYIWSDMAKDKELGIKTVEGMRIINAQSPDHQYIRVSMIPTLLSFVRENKAYADTFGIFEIGHTVDGTLADGTCNELTKLGACLFSKSESEEALFMRCRDVIAELVGDILHKKAEFVSCEPRFEYMHPVNTFAVKVDGSVIGTLSVPHPTVLASIDKKCAVAFFEITTKDFAAIEAGKVKYSEPSKFPGVDIDLTFAVDISTVDLTALTALAKSVSGEYLGDVKVKDIYTADGITALTLRFSFVSSERTLTKGELGTDKIIEAFAAQGINMK